MNFTHREIVFRRGLDHSFLYNDWMKFIPTNLITINELMRSIQFMLKFYTYNSYLRELTSLVFLILGRVGLVRQFIM